MNLLNYLRKIPDFPKSGISFYDVTSWISRPECMQELEALSEVVLDMKVDKIIAIDARGFIVGTQLSRILNVPLFLARKPGKLPVKVDSCMYALEYGTDTICLERGVIHEGDSVLIADDLLATGGTINAVKKIVSEYNPASITAFVWIELFCEGLNGRKWLEEQGVTVKSLFRIG